VGFVRAAVLSGYFETMADLAIDPGPLLAEQGLDRNLLRNPEQLIPVGAAVQLFERSAEASDCLSLGLRMAGHRTVADLGAISLLIVHQPTLRHVIEALLEYRTRLNSTMQLQLEEHGDEAVLREDFVLDRPYRMRQASDLGLGVLTQICGVTMGENWHPLMACFTHDALPAREQPVLDRVLGCPVQFDSEFNGIVISREDLDRPNALANARMADHTKRLIDATLPPLRDSWAFQVEQMIRLLLPQGRATIQLCAASMGINLRTMQRTLEAEGTTFSELLERIRRQMAVQYLHNPRIRIAEIAVLLGYGSSAAFARWHLQAFGYSPREARHVR